jgi:hypothetical protein
MGCTSWSRLNESPDSPTQRVGITPATSLARVTSPYQRFHPGPGGPLMTRTTSGGVVDSFPAASRAVTVSV